MEQRNKKLNMTRINIFEVVKASRNDIDIKMCVSGQIMPEDLYRQWAQQVIAELQLIRQNEWQTGLTQEIAEKVISYLNTEHEKN